MNDIKNVRLGGKKIGFSVLDVALPEIGFCIPHTLGVRKSMHGGQCSVFVSVT